MFAIPYQPGIPRRTVVFSLLCAFGLLGCASAPRGAKPVVDKPQTLWPAPPADPRFMFETELCSLANITIETDLMRARRKYTGIGVSKETAYKKPAGIAARGGRIFVADPQKKVLILFDVPRQRIISFGTRAPNNVLSPRAVSLDKAGQVYVLDDARKAVMVYDPLGLYLFSVGNKEQMTRPVAVAVSADGERIYIVDRGGLNDGDHKVLVYHPDGRLLQTLGPRGRKDGEFDIPVGAAVAPDGTLAVLDSGNFRVQLFDRDGKFLSAFGSAGKHVGQFARPRGIAMDAAGRIYVSDASFNNVQIFERDGAPLMFIGAADRRSGPGRFALAGAVAVDETGRLYVADEFHQKIEVYRFLGSPTVPAKA